MTAALITPPALEPVSLEEAKAHLRVDGEEEDGLIGAAIAAARRHVEAETRRVLIAQEWRIWRDAWPAGRLLALPVAPVISVDAVTVYDAAGDPTVLAAGDYATDLASVPARLQVAAGAARPGQALNGIEIDLTAGHGAAAEDVPAPLRQAILMLVAHWHENRSALAPEAAGAVAPLGFAALVAPYRVVRL